jgi:hypothetical protein
MEVIYLFICVGVFAIAAGIWGYLDYKKHTKRS